MVGGALLEALLLRTTSGRGIEKGYSGEGRCVLKKGSPYVLSCNFSSEGILYPLGLDVDTCTDCVSGQACATTPGERDATRKVITPSCYAAGLLSAGVRMYYMWREGIVLDRHRRGAAFRKMASTLPSHAQLPTTRKAHQLSGEAILLRLRTSAWPLLGSFFLSALPLAMLIGIASSRMHTCGTAYGGRRDLRKRLIELALGSWTKHAYESNGATEERHRVGCGCYFSKMRSRRSGKSSEKKVRPASLESTTKETTGGGIAGKGERYTLQLKATKQRLIAKDAHPDRG